MPLVGPIQPKRQRGGGFLSEHSPLERSFSSIDTITTMPNETFALFDTTEGKFKIKLFADKAPKTVENFVSLAEGAKTGKRFYDGLIFHRVIPNFMIQGGCPQGTGTGGPGYKFADEFHPSLRHSKKGILSMANSGPNTNGSQFFITVAETSWLDNKHTVFGEVVEGYDVVEKISKVPKNAGDRPSKDVKINSVTIERT
jgi:peptidyl-prolyl cis-trans isomerase A (cyclophilin A)